MAAYGSLVSLMNLIDQIQDHPRPPITLAKQHVESLRKDTAFLQEFLELYPHDAITQADDGVESHIAAAVYAVEDMIESYIADRNRGSTSQGETMKEQFDKHMEKVILDLSSVQKKVTEIKEKLAVEDYQLHKQLAPMGSLHKSESTVMVFDDVLIELMDKLTGYPCSLQIIPIHGMGGIGKTTLAKTAYENFFITNHFHIRFWVTISQENSVREMLLQFHEKEFNEMDEAELGEKLYKTLFGRRYLVVMDDMWSIEAWDEVKRFFPDNSDGSRIMVTTRLSSVAFQLSNSYYLKMNFLDEDASWNLLCKYVFGDKACPIGELEKIGRSIAKDCNGLPLSIAVIGRFLAKSQMTIDYWEHIAKHMKSFLYLEDEERCLQILQTSYSSLPVHLKPCFLYVGVFGEDSKIVSSELINMWISEGFVKPIRGKSLEEAAKMYLDDLVDRNLISCKHEFKLDLSTFYCSVHDVIRELCLREGEKEKFLFHTIKHYPHHVQQGGNPHRRLVVCQSMSGRLPEVFDVLKSFSHVRTLVCESQNVSLDIPLKLCRVLKGAIHESGFGMERSKNVIHQLLNTRFLHVSWIRIPTWIDRFWNLQTFVISKPMTDLKLDIWKMYRLRHVEVWSLSLTDPPVEQSSTRNYGLDNLQTLYSVTNFDWSEDVVKRIPNIKALTIQIDLYIYRSGIHNYHLDNLGCLQKLEHLSCSFTINRKKNELAQSLVFPYSLRTLSLYGFELHWDVITTRIGSLPFLQELKLHESGAGPQWNSIEGKFTSLRTLILWHCGSLREWTAESAHFPCLERLVLRDLDNLSEIPSGIGDIPTLQYIEVDHCNESLWISAKEIEEEQKEIGNDILKVDVRRRPLQLNWEHTFPHRHFIRIRRKRGGGNVLPMKSLSEPFRFLAMEGAQTQPMRSLSEPFRFLAMEGAQTQRMHQDNVRGGGCVRGQHGRRRGHSNSRGRATVRGHTAAPASSYPR